MIRNDIFQCESLGISYLWVNIWDSSHVQQAICTSFHEEFESAVGIDQFLCPEEKIEKNQPTRESISYRKISYAHMLIVVAFLVVNFFGFLVITRHHGSFEGRH